MSTLRFGVRAKRVKNTAKVNVGGDSLAAAKATLAAARAERREAIAAREDARRSAHAASLAVAAKEEEVAALRFELGRARESLLAYEADDDARRVAEDLADMLRFVSRYCPDAMESDVDPAELVRFVVMFVGRPAYIKTPYLRAKLVEVVSQYSPDISGGRRSRFFDAVLTAPYSVASFAPALMQYYVDIEAVDFYSRINFRYSAQLVLKSLWKDQRSRAGFVQAAAGPVSALAARAARLDLDAQHLANCLWACAASRAARWTALQRELRADAAAAAARSHRALASPPPIRSSSAAAAQRSSRRDGPAGTGSTGRLAPPSGAAARSQASR